jgi:hypothetical protein
LAAHLYPHTASLERLIPGTDYFWGRYETILTFRSFVSGQRKYWYLREEVMIWCRENCTGSFEIPSVTLEDDLRRNDYGFKYSEMSFQHEEDMIAFTIRWL